MIITPDPDLAARMRRLREHGMSVSAAERHAGRQPVIERYLEVGYNYRMTDIQAAIGLVQLGRLGDIIARRRELAQRYQRLLGQIPGVKMIADPAYGTTNFQSFWVALPEDFPMTRNELLQHLASAGISARRGIMAAHLEPALRRLPARGSSGDRAALLLQRHPAAVPPAHPGRAGPGDLGHVRCRGPAFPGGPGDSGLGGGLIAASAGQA